LFLLGVAVFILLLAQMGIGEAQYRTHLPWPLVLVHVALAAGVWATVVAFVTVLWRPPAAFQTGRA
jgi:heme A synthase